MGRAYSCWMLNCWCITWPVGFKRLILQEETPKPIGQVIASRWYERVKIRRNYAISLPISRFTELSYYCLKAEQCRSAVRRALKARRISVPEIYVHRKTARWHNRQCLKLMNPQSNRGKKHKTPRNKIPIHSRLLTVLTTRFLKHTCRPNTALKQQI